MCHSVRRGVHPREVCNQGSLHASGVCIQGESASTVGSTFGLGSASSMGASRREGGLGRYLPPAREIGKRPRLILGLGSILTGGNNFYRPQWSCEGNIFTPVCLSFCLQWGLPQCMLGYPTGKETLRTRHPPARRLPQQGDRPSKETMPPNQAPPSKETAPARRPPWQGDQARPRPNIPPARTPPRQGDQPLQQTVGILLECILVL